MCSLQAAVVSRFECLAPTLPCSTRTSDAKSASVERPLSSISLANQRQVKPAVSRDAVDALLPPSIEPWQRQAVLEALDPKALESKGSGTAASLEGSNNSKTISQQLQKRIAKTKVCYHNVRGKCTRGESCSFAHNLWELRRPPDLTKTKLCNDFSATGSCPMGSACRYAHGRSELRSVEEAFNRSTSSSSSPPDSPPATLRKSARSVTFSSNVEVVPFSKPHSSPSHYETTTSLPAFFPSPQQLNMSASCPVTPTYSRSTTADALSTYEGSQRTLSTHDLTLLLLSSMSLDELTLAEMAEISSVLLPQLPQPMNLGTTPTEEELLSGPPPGLGNLALPLQQSDSCDISSASSARGAFFA